MKDYEIRIFDECEWYLKKDVDKVFAQLNKQISNLKHRVEELKEAKNTLKNLAKYNVVQKIIAGGI